VGAFVHGKFADTELIRTVGVHIKFIGNQMPTWTCD
jgi:hypothetical protein